MDRFEYDSRCRTILQRARRYMQEEGEKPEKAVRKAVEWTGFKMDHETIEYLILELKNPGGGPRVIRYILKEGFPPREYGAGVGKVPIQGIDSVG